MIDDLAFNLFALQAVLKAIFDVDCDTAESGEKGIEMIQERIQLGGSMY